MFLAGWKMMFVCGHKRVFSGWIAFKVLSPQATRDVGALRKRLGNARKHPSRAISLNSLLQDLPISKTVSTATDTSPGMLLQPSRRGELVPETLPHCSEPHNKGQQDGWPKVNKGVIMASDSERAESFA
jgi:hypothetical protein